MKQFIFVFISIFILGSCAQHNTLSFRKLKQHKSSETVSSQSSDGELIASNETPIVIQPSTKTTHEEIASTAKQERIAEETTSETTSETTISQSNSLDDALNSLTEYDQLTFPEDTLEAVEEEPEYSDEQVAIAQRSEGFATLSIVFSSLFIPTLLALAVIAILVALSGLDVVYLIVLAALMALFYLAALVFFLVAKNARYTTPKGEKRTRGALIFLIINSVVVALLLLAGFI